MRRRHRRRRRRRSSVSSLLFVRRASDMKDVEANLLENPVFAAARAALHSTLLTKYMDWVLKI